MIVRSLALEGFRNYEALHVDFHPQVNLIYGDNAQGKTICWRPSPICPPPGPTGPGMTGR